MRLGSLFSGAAVIDMSKPEHFEILKEHAVFRPMGQVTLKQAAELVTKGIAFARSLNIRKLLIDITNLTGFEPPDIAMRYFIVHEWAHAAGGVRVAVVAKPEIIDHQKFGTTVASNTSFKADIFTTEEDALIWLERI
jgi:hypothetical protein